MGLRYMTAGESHGFALAGILEGMPSGVGVCSEDFTRLLNHRRIGYGRGARQKIELDKVKVLSGIYNGITIGSPIALIIENIDHPNHSDYMCVFRETENPLAVSSGIINVPLPGHADLAGAVKYGLDDCRFIRERASARETAMRTALSLPARVLLQELDISSVCMVESIGGVKANIDYSKSVKEQRSAIDCGLYDFLTPDPDIVKVWRNLVDESASQKKSLGGTVSIIFENLPIGLGSHVHYDRRLDARIAGLMMSIPAVKGVEIGQAIELANTRGDIGDAIIYSQNDGWKHTSNFNGGINGGISNGMPIVIRLHMKPLPANSNLPSVNLKTGKISATDYYRSDVHALPATAIVAESIIALELAKQLLELLGGDDIKTISHRLSELRLNQHNLR